MTKPIITAKSAINFCFSFCFSVNISISDKRCKNPAALSVFSRHIRPICRRAAPSIVIVGIIDDIKSVARYESPATFEAERLGELRKTHYSFGNKRISSEGGGDFGFQTRRRNILRFDRNCLRCRRGCRFQRKRHRFCQIAVVAFFGIFT